MRKVLFVGIGGDDNTKEIVTDLKDSGHVNFAAGVIDESQDHSCFDEVIAYWHQCLFADYSHASFRFRAIDDTLYSQIQSVEGNILRQMDRLLTEPAAITRATPFSGTFNDRRQLMFNHLRFWDLILVQYQFDAVIFANVPHLVGDTVLYSLCRARGIATLLFREISVFPGTQFISETIDETGVLNLGLQLRADESSWLDTSNRVWGDWQRQCDFADRTERVSHVPVLPYSLVRSLINEGRIGSSPTLNSTLKSTYRRIRATPSAIRRKTLRRSISRYFAVAAARRREIKHLVSSPLPNRFLFFPLHFQPEASTSAVGRHYVELYEVAAAIHQELPSDVYLVIKEHPHQYDKLIPRDPDFFNRITSLPRVRLVDSTIDSKELRKNCLGIVTVSGSNGFEALVCGKPVVAFGSPVWREALGVMTIRSEHDVRTAMSEVLSNRKRDRHEYLPFLTRVKCATVLADLSDAGSNKSIAERSYMKLATRKNVSRIISRWLDLRVS